MSLFRRRATVAHTKVNSNSFLNFEHVGSTPMLHMFSSSMSWWQKVVKKKTLAKYRIETLQHLLKWLRTKPDFDLQGCEMLCNVSGP